MLRIDCLYCDLLVASNHLTIHGWLTFSPRKVACLWKCVFMVERDHFGVCNDRNTSAASG